MKKRLKTYIVTVEVRTIELYEVDAESPDEAMEPFMVTALVSGSVMEACASPPASSRTRTATPLTA